MAFKRREIETSWNKLETSFITTRVPNSSPPKDNRAKSTTPHNDRIKKTHKQPLNSHRSIVMSPNRNISSINDYAESVSYRPVTAPLTLSPVHPRPQSSLPNITVEGLTLNQLHKIYEAKCADLKIPLLYDQEKRFFNCCFKHFTSRKFILKEAGLGSNAAKAIGESLANNSSFAFLELGKNTMGDLGVVILAKLLSRNNSIVHLDISSNDITPEGASSIFAVVSSHSSLMSLDISSHEGLHRNRLGLFGATSVRNALLSSPILAFVNIAGTSLGSDGLEQIIEGLRDNRILVSLDISSNALGSNLIENFAQAIVTTNLQYLDISNNQIGTEGSEYLGNMIMGAYSGGCPLQTLNISKNDINTRGVSFIFDSLRRNSQLKSLNLEKNSMPHGPSQHFLPFLIDNVCLSNLNLNNCDLKSEGVHALIEGLGKNKGLENLHLSCNEIADQGAEALSFGLARNSRLKNLDLSNNKIKNKGGIALGNALKINQTLQELNLKENNIKDDAGQLLSEISRFNRNILKLVLDLNPINFKYMNDIRNNIKNNRNLHHKLLVPKLRAKLGHMQVDEDVWDRIREKISIKTKEKAENEDKFEKQNLRLEEIKHEEDKKLNGLREELLDLKTRNFDLSKSLDKISAKLHSEKTRGEKDIRDWTEKIAYVVSDTKHLEKLSKIYIEQQTKEQASLKNSKTHDNLDRLKEQLKQEINLKKNAESSFSFLVKKLEEKKSTVESFKNTKTYRSLEPKSFLASEKLASTKKKLSKSPLKERNDTRSLTPVNRPRSLSQKKRVII